MKRKTPKNRTWLLTIAKAVAARQKEDSKGMRIRIRVLDRASQTITDGWRVAIGDLGKNRPLLELWYDRFTGYPERKLYAGFQSQNRKSITAITEQVTRKLWPIRVITLKDINLEKDFVLAGRLARSEFNAPILEKYAEGETYFGIYDPTRETTEIVSPHFCNRAVAFFEDVAQSLPHAKSADEHRDVYPRYENRKQVASYLRRERSRLLATERKIKDNYVCQVCNMRFEDVYGKSLGQNFAEAHHLVPLGQLRENIKTSLKDLRTVRANCHRILLRMNGKREDVAKLRGIVRKNR